MAATRKIHNEIYKRIVNDESGTGSVVDVLKSIFLMCAISPEGLINAAQVKLKLALKRQRPSQGIVRR